MKKSVTLTLFLMLSLGLASAACDLDVKLLNQDPYPAVPNDYVKLVFQLEGLDSPECNDVTFELLSDYPIEFNPGETGFRTFRKLDFIKDYESNLLIPYEVRINEQALDGANPIEVRVQSRGDAPVTKTFDLEVDDVRAEFEVSVKDYSYATNEITLEVLNIEAADIEALTIEIPKQDIITVKGSNRVIVGDLDSNEYTSADFEASLSDGEFIVNLIYSDKINERRTVQVPVYFDSSYFTNRKADQPKPMGVGTYIFWGIVASLAGYWVYRKVKKSKAKKK